MKATKNLAIWMDHSAAQLIDLRSDNKGSSIQSNFNFENKEEALQKSESLMHHKEQQMQNTYYKSIAEHILDYNHVLLFGPTDAKRELHNYLSKNTHFKDIKIDVESADKMTDNEKHAFAKKHFEQQL